MTTASIFIILTATKPTQHIGTLDRGTLVLARACVWHLLMKAVPSSSVAPATWVCEHDIVETDWKQYRYEWPRSLAGERQTNIHSIPRTSSDSLAKHTRERQPGLNP